MPKARVAALAAPDERDDLAMDDDHDGPSPDDHSDGRASRSVQDVLDAPLAPWLLETVQEHHGGSFVAWSLRVKWASQPMVHQVNVLCQAMDAMFRDFGAAAHASESFEVLARRLTAIYMNELGYGWDVGNALAPKDPVNFVPRHVLKAALRETNLRKKVAPAAAAGAATVGGGGGKWSGAAKPKSNPRAGGHRSAKAGGPPKSGSLKGSAYNDKKRSEPSPKTGGAGATN